MKKIKRRKRGIHYVLEDIEKRSVMKAIGIRNRKIRSLYLAKYATLSVVGAVIGLALSFPFGEMLMCLSSKSIIINNQNTAFANVLCAVLMVGVIMLFCYGCTGKVGKMSPIDAVRNGQTGERFRKKSIMSLGRSKLPATPFLALNDIVSSPKRFGIITFAFFLCLSLLLILSSTVSTMKGGTFANALALADFDISAKCEAIEFMTVDGHEKLKEYLSDMEENLAQNNMPARCMQEMMFNLPVSHGENESNIFIYQGTGTTADMYEYIEGTPPQSADEPTGALNRASSDEVINELLSLSHDIKTPLSAIKLGAKALARGLYKDEGKQRAIADSINTRADEIERFVSEITKAASEDFMSFEVTQKEAFLSDIITRIDARYTPQLAMSGTEFAIQKYDDCILSCDPDRLAECLQNLIENAIKYGDGRRIEISFDKMDGCELITVSNAGCTPIFFLKSL